MRKLIIAAALAVIAATAVTAQGPAPAAAEEAPVNFSAVDEKPAYPGGNDAMWEWLLSNIHYPREAAKDSATGIVTVEFIVEKDGSITHPRVTRGVHPALDAEALRLVTAMPKWTPGVLDDTIVRTVSYLPISFFATDRYTPKPAKATKKPAAKPARAKRSRR